MIQPTSFFLLRGLARERRHWVGFPGQLEAAAAGARAVPLEIPGAGILRQSKAPLGLPDYIPQLRSQYQDELRADRDNVLVGLSLGGMLAAQWLHDHPGDFTAAVLINSSSTASPPFRRMRPGAALTLLRASCSRDCTAREEHIAGLVCNLADSAALARSWGAICRESPMTGANIIRQLLAAARFSLPPRPALPVLLLCAEKDRLAAPSCSRDIARLWDVPLISHDRAGHDLPTDDPVWCASTIVDWLDGPVKIRDRTE